MRTEIKTRNYGTIAFRCSEAGGYVYVTTLSKTLLKQDQSWRQICYWGKLSGDAVTYNWTEERFPTFCRLWWRAFLRNQRSI